MGGVYRDMGPSRSNQLLWCRAHGDRMSPVQLSLAVIPCLHPLRNTHVRTTCPNYSSAVFPVLLYLSIE